MRALVIGANGQLGHDLRGTWDGELLAFGHEQLDGDHELLPGVRLLSAPGHTDGSQIVVVGTGAHPTVICGDTAVFHHQLDQPETEGQRLIRSLEPEAVWLSHADEPWRPDASGQER